MLDQLLSLDKTLFIFLNTFLSNPFLDAFFLTITDSRSWIIPVILAGTLFIFKQRKKALIVLLLAIITIAATDLISVRLIKPLIGRLRPCHPDILIEGCNFLSGTKRSLSFPSAHATNMFGQAVIFSYFYPKRILVFVSFAVLIGFSRIYVGVHYPGDIIGGFVVGLIIASIVLTVYRIIKKNLSKRRLQQSGNSLVKENAA